MESCQVVPHGTVVFRPAWWARHAATRAASLLRVNRGRLIVLHPIDARAHALVTGLPHILPTAEGVLDVSPEEDNAPRRRPFVPWSAIGPARVTETAVTCEGLGAIECGSSVAARLWARVLNTLRSAPPPRRAVLAERWLRLRFDPAIARRRHERLERACAGLEWVATIAFVLIVAGAAVVTQRASAAILLGFLGTGVVSGFALAIAYWRAHARLAPRAWSTRLGRAAMMAVCFPVAYRARAGLGRDALALSHPTAAATVLLAEKPAGAFLAEAMRRWRHRSAPPPPGSSDESHLARAAEAVHARLAALATGIGLDPATLEGAPALDDPAIRTWCPRCHATYVHASGTCSDCPGVALRPVSR